MLKAVSTGQSARPSGQLQLFPSVQAIRRPRCGAATRANSLPLLIIHAVYFDSPPSFAKMAGLSITRGIQYPTLV